MQKFHDLVIDQFRYGGKKYAEDTGNVFKENEKKAKKEATDILFDVHGKNWLFGTMDKYCFRFRNLERERDLLKIGCYCYILWLKRGFWVKPEGLVSDALDTTVKVKEEQFELFIDNLTSFLANDINECTLKSFKDRENKVEYMSNVFQQWSRVSWERCTQQDLFSVYYTAFLLWFEKYSKVEEHDTDTYNEQQEEAR